MTNTKTARAKDGRVLPVLEKDYKKLYEQSLERARLKDEQYRRNQVKKETEDSTGFGGAARCTSFKHMRNLENQENQKRKAQEARETKPVITKAQNRLPFYHPNCNCPEPGSPEFDSRLHGLLAPPRTRHLLNGEYID